MICVTWKYTRVVFLCSCREVIFFLNTSCKLPVCIQRNRIKVIWLTSMAYIISYPMYCHYLWQMAYCEENFVFVYYLFIVFLFGLSSICLLFVYCFPIRFVKYQITIRRFLLNTYPTNMVKCTCTQNTDI